MKVDWPTFAGGEIGDDLLARTDTAKYRTALRRARNVTILPAGGVARRPGFLLGGEVYDSTAKTRTIPFQFSVNQGYAMELGPNVLRLLSRGGYVLRKELLVDYISNSYPAIVTIQNHGYEVGWDIVFQNIQGMTEVNGLSARILSISGDQLYVDLDTTSFGVFLGSGGGVAGNSQGGEGGYPPPAPPPAPTDPPVQPPPFEDTIEYPPIFMPGPFDHFYLP